MASEIKKSPANLNSTWNTDSRWLEVSVVTIFFLLGHIYFGHSEERSPKWRKLLKYMITLFIIIAISVYFGRVYAFSLLALAIVPVIYVHGVLLPRKGINGWTGELKSRYYDFRGWDKIFLKSQKILRNFNQLTYGCQSCTAHLYQKFYDGFSK